MTSTTTNQTQPENHRAIFAQLLREMGVERTHGLELLGLVKMCNRAYDNILGEEMRQSPISMPQWRLLVRLLVEEQLGDGCLTPTELAHSQRLSKNTISAHLRALEEQRLIQREIDPDDLRAFRIQLSDEGRQTVRHTLPMHINLLNDLVCDLTDPEIAELERLLEKMHRSLLRCVESNGNKINE